MPPIALLTWPDEYLFGDREQNDRRVGACKDLMLFGHGVIHSAFCTAFMICFALLGRIQFPMTSMMRLRHGPDSPVWPFRSPSGLRRRWHYGCSDCSGSPVV